MPHTFYQIWIHLVWATKKRAPVLIEGKRKMIFEHMKESASARGYYIDSINGVEDHVHCLLSLQPKYALSKVVKDLKGESSRWINENYVLANPFEWQEGYGAFSVSNQNVPAIREYIKKQVEHHRKFSYEEEINRMKLLSQTPSQ
jgi:REP element-mobilizing transposase RayT